MAEVGRSELQAYIEDVAAELPDVSAREEPAGIRYEAGGVPFALVGRDRASFRLRPDVAGAATRTPNVRLSDRGPEWVELAPVELDRFALDRAESWFVSAYRYAAEGASGGG